MKLSVVIVCWNDLEVIIDCIESVYAETKSMEIEVLVSDNGSTDGSPERIREQFPQAKILDNNANLGFSKGNNVGIEAAQGDYVLILNPDTIIHDRALEKWVAFADAHPETGSFGCRVLERDGSFQHDTCGPFPTVGRYLSGALYLSWLGRFFPAFNYYNYVGWDGRTQRTVGYQAGCAVLFRRELIQALGGFDEQFFYFFEEIDLCYRATESGNPILYYPDAEITHLKGASVGRFPIKFELERYRSRYRYFYKHYGERGAWRIRTVSLLHLRLRQIGFGVRRIFDRSEALANRLKMYRVVAKWNKLLDPVQFVLTGAEPDLGYEPLQPPPKVETATVDS